MKPNPAYYRNIKSCFVMYWYWKSVCCKSGSIFSWIILKKHLEDK